jgi:hypothetical protein
MVSGFIRPLHVERMSEEELAYLTRRVVRLCNAQRVGNSRGVIKMWIVSTVLVSLFSLMSMVYDSDGGSLQWAASPNISYLDVDSPIESSKVEDAIDYVVWSWGSRIPGLGIKYVGLTLGPIENAIVIPPENNRYFK